jgi:hypothetical protein
MVHTGYAADGVSSPVAFCPIGGKPVRPPARLAGAAAPIDFLKLVQIRTALSRGTYAINSRAIADAIAQQAHL